jgi:hypothetical protein
LSIHNPKDFGAPSNAWQAGHQASAAAQQWMTHATIRADRRRLPCDGKMLVFIQIQILKQAYARPLAGLGVFR